MNKEQQELLDEAYENYEKITNNFQLENPIDDFIIKTLGGEMIKIETEDGDDYRILTQEEFINKIKTNPDFAKQWGVTIYTVVEDGNIRIGVNYNNETIESYES